jgi:hypothetical protein
MSEGQNRHNTKSATTTRSERQIYCSTMVLMIATLALAMTTMIERRTAL